MIPTFTTKKLNIFSLILASMFLVSSVSAAPKSDMSSYAGKWSAQFTGGDNGAVNVVVANDGSVTGSGTSSLAGKITVSGQIAHDGKTVLFATSGGASTSATFTGTASMNGTANGVWTNKEANLNGTWNATRP